jgi:hypothetical protein
MTPDLIPATAPVENLTALLSGSPVVARMYRDLKRALPMMAQVDRYLEGDHPLAFASDKFQTAFGDVFKEFADNYCPKVISAVTDRLKIEGVTVADKGAQKAVDEWLKANRLDRLSDDVHESALSYGDGYVVLAQTAAGDWRLYAQNSDEVRVLYDPEDRTRIHCAIKVWRQLDGSHRLNLYQRESTIRFVTEPRPETVTAALSGDVCTPLPANLSEFRPYAGDEAGPVVPHAAPGCPVFHFPHQPRRDGHGRSRLTDIIPVQDALNKTVCDALVGAEFHALPQRYAAGIEMEIDEATGKPKAPFIADTLRLWVTGNGEARFGQFNAADLSQLREQAEGFRIEIARLGDIPLHFLTLGEGSFPSGEALKTAEKPLMAVVSDLQVLWGDAWEDAVMLWFLLSAGVTVAAEAKWANTSSRNEKEAAEAEQVRVDTGAAKVELGVSRKQALREAGYTDEQIEQFDAEREAEARDAQERQAAAVRQGAGLPPGGAGEDDDV